MAATYLCAVAAAGGEGELLGTQGEDLGPVLAAPEAAGCETGRAPNRLWIRRRGPLGGVGSLCTGPYPAFPTDAQPLLAAALAGGTGKSRITETIFDRRFRYTEGLCAMGAAIQVEGDTAYILGRPLHGAQVAATDLRGGAALTVAALGAQGPSRIWGLDHVDRAYEGLETALAALGKHSPGDRPVKRNRKRRLCGRRKGYCPGTGAAFRPVKGNRIWQRKKKNADIANGGEARLHHSGGLPHCRLGGGGLHGLFPGGRGDCGGE